MWLHRNCRRRFGSSPSPSKDPSLSFLFNYGRGCACVVHPPSPSHLAMWATRCDELEADIVPSPAAICQCRTAADAANVLRIKRRHCPFERPLSRSLLIFLFFYITSRGLDEQKDNVCCI